VITGDLPVVIKTIEQVMVIGDL